MMKKPITCAEAGRKGGLARAASLSPERRKEIARKAVQARWAKVRQQKEQNHA